MLLILLLTTIASTSEPPVVAGVVFINGKIWTVDPAKPEVQAVAVRRNRIVVLGSDAELKQLIGVT